jgi:hypothetical protein
MAPVSSRLRASPTRFALHGGRSSRPTAASSSSCRVTLVTKYDLWTLTTLAEVRAGVNARNIALSRDGKHIAVANYLPHSLVILSSDDLSVEKIFDAKDKRGTILARLGGLSGAAARFIHRGAEGRAGDLGDRDRSERAAGLFRPGAFARKGNDRGLAVLAGLFALRRIEIPEPLDDFFFDPSYRNSCWIGA